MSLVGTHTCPEYMYTGACVSSGFVAHLRQGEANEQRGHEDYEYDQVQVVEGL